MSTRKDRGGENSHPRQKDWLSLGVGQRTRGFSSNSIANTSMKLYTCSFCKRKFYSPQALGGHQNAHRREKEAAGSALNANQLIDVHSVVQAPIRDKENTATKTTDININEALNDVTFPVQNYAREESVDLKWIGTSYSNLQPVSQKYDPHTLDLDLKL